MTQLWDAGESWRDVADAAEIHDAVESVIGMLDRGEVRVAEAVGDDVVVNEWVKHAILMWFRVQEMAVIEAGPFEYADKLPLKHNYLEAGVRVVPGASARFGAYLARGVVMMPSYVNIGARVESGTMVDTWATVGSCAQIGANVHLSGGVGIGGVLEPPQASPVIIEDDCFIGSRSMIVEGRLRCHPHVDRARDRSRHRPGSLTRRHSRTGGRRAGHTDARIQGRHLRAAVCAHSPVSR